MTTRTILPKADVIPQAEAFIKDWEDAIADI
jgi:hypothetical protein